MEVAKDDEQISNKDPIFAEYFKIWYETFKIIGKSNNTKRRYARIYDLIKLNFPDIKISKMNRLKYQKFINSYGSTHVKDTVKKRMDQLDHALKMRSVKEL